MPDAGRIIAGVARGIRLDAPGPATRPLADRVKQTLFAILEPDLPGSRVLTILGRADAPLRPGARVVAKHFWRDRPPERVGMLKVERERRFGESALTFYRREESA